MRLNKLLREPVLYFFLAGAALFVAHHLLVGAPRTVTATAAVRNNLARLFQEANGREPTAAELAKDVHKWQIDEALSREALREHLDRDDPGIRTILADKMRLRAQFEVPKRDPTTAELDAYLATHGDQFRQPVRYDYEYVAFPSSAPRAREALEAFEADLRAGKPPASLGRPVMGGNLTAADLKDRLDATLAARIPQLPPDGSWQRVESPQNLYLARLKSLRGGVPTRDALGERLVEEWKRDAVGEATDRILQRTLDRYRFEVEP